MENTKAQLVEDAVPEAVAGTLGDLMFMEVTATKQYWAQIPIIEPFSGSLITILPESLATELTMASLGDMEGQDVAVEVIQDSVAEIANVITGTLIRSITEADKNILLGCPLKGFGIIKLDSYPSRVFVCDVQGRNFIVVVQGQEFCVCG